MPDITMCKGENCPFKEQCYRYRAKPSEHGQSYFESSPIQEEGCEYFVKYWGDKKRKMKDEIKYYEVPSSFTNTL